MGSPITFSGFNSIDFNMILNAVMQQERAPLTALETQKKTLETQNTTYGTFLSKLTSLERAISDLAGVNSLAALEATSSDAGVGVSTTSGTVEGSYDVVVSQLARSQVTASASSYASVDAEVATSGTLTLLTVNQLPVDIVVTGSMTLRQLADAINAKSDAPVTASVVQAAPGSYRLVLTGRTTGADHAFTLTSTLSGGQGLAFADANGNGVFGEAVDGNAQEARDAALTVNNLPITSSSNTVSDVIPGVTLTLLKEDGAKTATVNVSRDSKEVKDLLDKFVSAYNDIHAFVQEQNTAAATGKASIARDPVLKGFRDRLRSAMLASYPDGGAYSRLSSIGVGVDAAGKLKVDEKRLEAALKDSPAAVQQLFSGAGGNGGVFGALAAVVKSYTEAGGLVATVKQRINDQVTNLNKRLDTLEMQLSIRRAALQQEFIAADMAMTQLKAQSSSLSSLGGQYRLF